MIVCTQARPNAALQRDFFHLRPTDTNESCCLCQGDILLLIAVQGHFNSQVRPSTQQMTQCILNDFFFTIIEPSPNEISQFQHGTSPFAR